MRGLDEHDAFDCLRRERCFDGLDARFGFGELVCVKPFPSLPLGFWNDEDGSKFRAAHFEKFPGVWHHGDYVEGCDSGGMIIQIGRASCRERV